MGLRTTRWLTTTPLAFLPLAFAIGAYAANEAPAADENSTSATNEARLPLDELRTFTQVFEQIRKTYVEEVDDKTLLENAISGLLQGLDPHSIYLDQEDFSTLQEHTRGEFGGIGIEVGMEQGAVLVIAPIDDTPAKAAGIEAGDLIIKIDDQLVRGLSQHDAINLMRGPKGSKVSLTILREGLDKPLELELSRDIIKTRSVRSRVLEPGFGYIRISQFQLETGSQFRTALQELLDEKEPLKGLILDLRNNPGGLLPAAIEVTDALLDGGRVTYTEGRLASANTDYNATPGDLTDNIPVVVIIDGGSASASEIVAGALQDHQRAVVLGTQSFGKGSVQTVMPISEDRGIKLTTARYFTPSGRSIQAEGIEPDIVVERAEIKPLEKRRYVKESNLAGHLSNGSHEKDLEEASEATIIAQSDNQLFEGLNVLKGAYILTRKASEM